MHTLAPPSGKMLDIEHLIQQLKPLLAAPPDWEMHYFRPDAQSPLGKTIAPAVTALQALEADDEFWHWLQTRTDTTPTPSETGWFWQYILVPLLNTEYSLPKGPEHRFSVMGHTFAFADVPLYWRHHMLALHTANRLVGNGIRSAGIRGVGIVRLDLALKFYGVAPAGSDLLHALRRLEELRSAVALDIEYPPMPLAELLDEQDDRLLQAAIELSPGQPPSSPLKRLTDGFMTEQRQAHASTTPTVILEQLLQTPACQALGARLGQALDWSDAQGEDLPAPIRAKLVWRGLWLSLCKPDRTAGHSLSTSASWGHTYAHLRSERQSSLQREHGLSPATTCLAMRILQDSPPGEGWVGDIPAEMRYATSSTWVNFKSALLLAEAVSPGACRRMTFQQLLDLPTTLSAQASPEQQAVICAARLGPTLEWASAHGVLAPHPGERSADELQIAMDALAQHEQRLRQAASDLALLPPGRWQFTSDTAFQAGFDAYLSTAKSAYGVLIKALLGSLPLAERHLIETGEVRVYVLREELHSVQLEHENPSNTGAVTGRQGFIIEARGPQQTRYVEVFARLGLIRLRPDISALQINGKVVVESTGGASRSSRGSFRRATPQPFDWAAYRQGTVARPGVSSLLIVEPLGPTLAANPASAGQQAPQPWLSARAEQVAQLVSRQLFYTDEQQLLDSARRNVELADPAEDFVKQLKQFGKALVPFWEGIEDLVSGEPLRIEAGGLALFTDSVSFAIPLGRYLCGSTRLAVQAGKIGLRAALPDFSALTRQLLLSISQELNPLEAIPDLFELATLLTLKAASSTTRTLERGLQQLRKRASVPGVPSRGRTLVPVDPHTWRPAQPGDRLFSVADLEHVPARQVGSRAWPEYRLIDPLTDQVFGPRFIEVGDAGLQAIANLDDYAVALPYAQAAQLSPRANGLYDAPHQQSYVQARGNWYRVKTRYSITGEPEVHIIHPESQTHRSHRIVLHDGVWIAPRQGLGGGMQRSRLQKMREANAARDSARQAKLLQMRNAIQAIEEASKSAKYRVALGADGNIMEELGSVYPRHTQLQSFDLKDFASLPDLGRARLAERLEELEQLRRQYARLAESFDALVDRDDKTIAQLIQLQRLEPQFKQRYQATLDHHVMPAKQAKSSIAQQTRVLQEIAHYDLERLLEAFDKLPAPKTAALPGPKHPQPGPSRPPTPSRPAPRPPAAPPRQRIQIVIPGNISVTVKPRADNPNIADALDSRGQRSATYIKTPTGELWVAAVDKLRRSAGPGPSTDADLPQRLNKAADDLAQDADKLDAIGGYFRNRHDCQPAGVEDRLLYGVNQLKQGALELEQACPALVDEAARQALLAKVASLRERASQWVAKAREIRIELTLGQAPDAHALDFLQAQEGLLRIRQTQRHTPGKRSERGPGQAKGVLVADFLDEFELKAGNRVWGYAHLHFDQVHHTRPAKAHLKTPAQRRLGPDAQARAERQGNRLTIYRADLHWPQVKRIFYPNLPDLEV